LGKTGKKAKKEETFSNPIFTGRAADQIRETFRSQATVYLPQGKEKKKN